MDNLPALKIQTKKIVFSLLLLTVLLGTLTCKSSKMSSEKLKEENKAFKIAQKYIKKGQYSAAITQLETTHSASNVLLSAIAKTYKQIDRKEIDAARLVYNNNIVEEITKEDKNRTKKQQKQLLQLKDPLPELLYGNKKVACLSDTIVVKKDNSIRPLNNSISSSPPIAIKSDANLQAKIDTLLRKISEGKIANKNFEMQGSADYTNGVKITTTTLIDNSPYYEEPYKVMVVKTRKLIAEAEKTFNKEVKLIKIIVYTTDKPIERIKYRDNLDRIWNESAIIDDKVEDFTISSEQSHLSNTENAFLKAYAIKSHLSQKVYIVEGQKQYNPNSITVYVLTKQSEDKIMSIIEF